MNGSADQGRYINFATSLSIQVRVIRALLMREILTRYGRHNIGFLWLFVEPMSFTLGVSVLWTLTGLGHASDIPIVAFAITGYSAVLLWRNMPSRLILCLPPNMALMYHRNVRVIDIYLARMLLEFIGATISFIVLSCVFISLDFMKQPEDILLVLEGWLMLAWFGATFAMALGAISESHEIVEKLWHPTAYIIMPLSGVAFIVDALPKKLQEIVLWIPMVHATEMVRDGYFGSLIRPHYDLSYLATVCLLMTFLALSQTNYLSRRVMLE